MTCTKQVGEIVECARRGTEPVRELRAHLAGCNDCAARWEAERQLTDQFRSMRLRAAALMALDTERDGLMRDFARLDLARQHRRKAVRSWALALGAAGALLVSVFVGHIAGTRAGQTPPRAIRTNGVRNAQTVFYEAGYDAGDFEASGFGASGFEASNDASGLSSDEFIAVPYTPPLAQGELVRVVHADLYPEALASMGIDIDPASASNVPADVVVGEDGIPRAVRITEDTQN
jgi:hypothetical protein